MYIHVKWDKSLRFQGKKLKIIDFAAVDLVTKPLERVFSTVVLNTNSLGINKSKITELL